MFKDQMPLFGGSLSVNGEGSLARVSSPGVVVRVAESLRNEGKLGTTIEQGGPKERDGEGREVIIA